MSSEAGITQYELWWEASRRLYLVHVPSEYDASEPSPLVVVLHGGGGSALFASRVHGWRELSQRERCLVVFPEAMLEDPDRPPGVRDNPRVWNDGGTRSAVAQRGVDDIGYLACVLEDVAKNYRINSRQVFMTGFSNGASMTMRAGVELADRLSAIAPVSGHLCLSHPQPSRPLSMFYLIGLADPLNPFEGGITTSPWGSVRSRPNVMESIRAWLHLIGAAETPVVLSDQDGVRLLRYGPGTSGREVQLCTIEGQGHEWPGAQRTLPRSISGPQTNKIIATQVIWDFFRSAHAADS